MKRATKLAKEEMEKSLDEQKIKKKHKSNLKTVIEEKENFQISIKENVGRCIDEKLNILLSDERVVDDFGRLYQGSINSRKFVGYFKSRIKHFFSEQLFVLINSIINKDLLRKCTTSLLKSSKKYYVTPLKLSETPKFLSLCWEIEFITSNKNSSLREVYIELRKKKYFLLE